MFSKDATAADACTPERNTAHASPLQASGVMARAKTLARFTTRENAPLRAHRERIAETLASALRDVKPLAIAVGMGVARTLVVRWMDARWADKRPAPLAMLLALDDEEFEAVVRALRDVRAER